jgi:hypothetical protein
MQVQGRLIVLAAVLLPILSKAAEPRVAIPKKSQTLIEEQLLPAYRTGSPVDVATSAQRLFPQLTEKQLAAVNAELADIDMPPLADMFAESLLALVRSTGVGSVNNLDPRSLAAVVPSIRREVKFVLEDAKLHPAFEEPLSPPDSLREFEQLFWQVHVFEQRIANAVQLQQFGTVLHQRALNVLRKATPEERQVLMSDFGLEGHKLEELQRDLAERKIELRLKRLDLANSTLKGSVDRIKLFESARAIDVDAPLLAEFFGSRKETDAPFRRAALNKPGLPKTIRALSSESEAIAGDLILKSRHFYSGIHWWLRGRFGMSTDGGGLLKPKLAHQSPQLMFQLFMPAELNAPRGVSQSPPQCQVERRHQLVWSFEPNQVMQKSTKRTDQDSTEKLTSRTTLNAFY